MSFEECCAIQTLLDIALLLLRLGLVCLETALLQRSNLLQDFYLVLTAVGALLSSPIASAFWFLVHERCGCHHPLLNQLHLVLGAPSFLNLLMDFEARTYWVHNSVERGQYARELFWIDFS